MKIRLYKVKLVKEEKRVRNFSPLWWLIMAGYTGIIVGGAISWYTLFYMMCSNPM